ncbi:hypothetical protein IV203_015479 [Nitzschia inconspicua]|uniref:Uncharacterized protein n=1 Tax=Nitzschia inconspicua TaxID=303405 RepID=A0A9K3LBU9_9STRA|nr:hypothetical protein IV203_015479 [Nitzschia inconspicua]
MSFLQPAPQTAGGLVPPSTPHEDAKAGFQFFFKPIGQDRLGLVRSTSMPSAKKAVMSLHPSRQPLQQLRMNGTCSRTASDAATKFVGGHHNVQRSYTLKGATNLPKQTHLLRKKMDRILLSFQETVVEHDKSQQMRLQQFQLENEKLRKANTELEVENLTYFKELEDCEEQIGELEQQRKGLMEKLAKLRQQYAEVETTLKEENTKLKGYNESLVRELKKYTDQVLQK